MSYEDDLSSLLADRRTALETTLSGYFATDSFMEKGGYVKTAIAELASLDWVRSEVLLPLLRQLDGAAEYSERVEDARRRRSELLVQLDELSKGVGAADVLFHRSARISELMTTLREDVLHYDQYEAAEVVPFITASVDRARLEELVRHSRAADARHISHPHPYGRSSKHWMGRMFSAFHDWLRDLGQHPDAAIEGKGEQGP